MVKKIAVITHRRPEKTGDAFRRVLKICNQREIEVVIPEREAEKHALEGAGSAVTIVSSLEETEVEMCIALGGDGTILRAFRRLGAGSTPVLGINFGRIGFLAALDPSAIPGQLQSVLEGNYTVMELTTLDLTVEGGRHRAVNDVVLQKAEGRSVAILAYEINGVEMDAFKCDGLVVSTPAGSTAYNLSNGGPLASLSLEVMILSAIAPHSLKFRSMVLGKGEILRISNRSGAPAEVCVDGQIVGSVQGLGVAEVCVSKQKAHLVRTGETDFFAALRKKFIEPEDGASASG